MHRPSRSAGEVPPRPPASERHDGKQRAEEAPSSRPRDAASHPGGESHMAIAQQQKATDIAIANANDFRAAMASASARDHASFEGHLRDDVTFVNPMVGTVDKAGFRAFHTALWTGLPDINYKVERTVSEGNTVVGECTVTGTQRGELAGVPATNKSVKLPVIFIVDYENGKVKRWSSFLDTATLLRQIGAMK